jgi:arsenate reductase (glutaredoxin)
MQTIIYHNPKCGTSRNTLALIRACGIEPMVIDYQQNPPTRARLEQLMNEAGLTPADLVRKNNNIYADMAQIHANLSDSQLLDAMMQHPALINRPLVETPKGVRLCRPSEIVLEILEKPLMADFTKEDGNIITAPPASRP